MTISVLRNEQKGRRSKFARKAGPWDRFTSWIPLLWPTTTKEDHSLASYFLEPTNDCRERFTPLWAGRTLFCFLAVLDPRVGHTMDILSPFVHLSIILIDSTTEGPVHVLMLSIQAVRRLHRLHAPGIVPCIIFFSRQFPCFLVVWP